MDPNQQNPYFPPPPGQAEGPAVSVQYYGQPAAGQPASGQPAPAGQATYGQPAPVQPTYGQPTYGHPAASQPAPGQLAYGHPAFGQAVAGQLVPGQPASGHPAFEQPVAAQQTLGQPALGQPALGQPALGQPALGQPALGQPALGQPAVGYPAPGQSAQSVPPQGATTPTWGREGSYTSPAALVAAANQTWGPPPTRKHVPSVYEQQQMKRQPQPLASRPTSLRGLYSNLKNEARAVATSLAAQRAASQYRPEMPGAQVVQNEPTVYAQVPIPQAHYYNPAMAPPPTVPQAYTPPGAPGPQDLQHYGTAIATQASITRKPLAAHAPVAHTAPATPVPAQQQYQYPAAAIPQVQYGTVHAETVSYQYPGTTQHMQPAQIQHHESQNRLSIYGQPQLYSQIDQATLPQAQFLSTTEPTVAYSPLESSTPIASTAAYTRATPAPVSHGYSADPDRIQGQPNTVPPVHSQYDYQGAAQNPAIQPATSFQEQVQYQHPVPVETAPAPPQAHHTPTTTTAELRPGVDAPAAHTVTPNVYTPSEEARPDPRGDTRINQALAPALGPNPSQVHPGALETSPAPVGNLEVSHYVPGVEAAQREAQVPHLPQPSALNPAANLVGVGAPQQHPYYAAPPQIPPKTPEIQAPIQVLDTRAGTARPEIQQPIQPVYVGAKTETQSGDILDQIQSLVTSMNHVSIAQPPQAAPGHVMPTPENPWIENDWRRPPLAISEDGEANDVVWDCPGSVQDVTYEATWFHLADVPDFLICTRCHDRFLRQTSLASSFNKIRRSNGRCRFNVPRITKALLPQCLQLQSTSLLQDYMLKRLGMKDCKDRNGVTGRDGFKWYIIKGDTNDVMINFVSCQACYEDIILASRYADEFMPREDRYSFAQPEANTWFCDLHFPYIRRSFNIYSRNNAPFADWVTKATRHFQIPDCEGAVVESSSREWVRTRDVERLVICEKCYFNLIAWTALEKDFEYIPIKKPVRGSEWMDKALGYREEEPTAWQCDGKGWPMRSAIEAAVKRQDMSVFLRAAPKIMASPPCQDNGIPNGTWYTLKGGCHNFEICPACLAGFGEAFDSHQFFEIGPRSGAPEAFRCNLNPKAPRYLQFILSLNEAQQEGVWSRYAKTVRKFADLPECPKDEHVPSRKWYGWHECLICPDCYQAVCEDTRGSLQFELENEVIEEIRMCSLYSPRMREKWSLACQKGDATELVEFSKLRTQAWVRTVPQIRLLRQQQELQMMTAMSAGFAGLMFQGAQSMQTISGSTDGYLHGNSSIGYHETENGVASAEKFNEMHSGFNAANSGGTWGRIFQLAAEWDKWQ